MVDPWIEIMIEDEDGEFRHWAYYSSFDEAIAGLIATKEIFKAKEGE